MILKVGNSTYNSNNVPVAIILSELDLNQLVKMPRKLEKVDVRDPKYVFAKCPSDIGPEILFKWLQEAVIEVKLEPALYVPGKKDKS